MDAVEEFIAAAQRALSEGKTNVELQEILRQVIQNA